MAARGAGLTSASVRSPRRYFALLAKHTGIDFLATKLVLMIHGPLRWARTSNGQPLDSLEDAEVEAFGETGVLSCVKGTAPTPQPSAYL